MQWVSPSIRVRWGPYFRTDPEEQTQIVSMVQAALGSGGTGEQLITKRMAVEKLASVFDAENVDAIMEALEKEAAEKAEKALKQKTEEVSIEASALHGAMKDDEGRGAPGGAKPPQAPGR